MNLRYRTLIPVVSLVLFLSSLHSQTEIKSSPLIPYRSGNLWGYARPGGALVVPPQFAEAGLFSRRLPFEARLRVQNIAEYDQLYPVFDKAVALVRKDSFYGLMDESGRFIVEPSSPVYPAFFAVDTNLVFVGIRKENADPEEYSESWSVALLHKSGRLLTPFEYDITIYEEGECSYLPPDDRFGNQSIRDQFSCAPRSLYSDYIEVQKNGKAGLIRKDGSVAYPPAWNQISLPKGDRVLACLIASTSSGGTQEQWVVAGPGNRIIKKLSPEICCVNTYARYGPVQASTGKEMGYLTAAGEWAFSEKFDAAGPFSKNGFAIVRDKSGAWKVIDSIGQKVIDLLGYNGCQPWRDGYYIQLKDSLFYAHDRHFKKTGVVGLDGAPEDLFYRGKLYRSARLHGKCGLLDEQERIIVPFRYGYPLSVDRNIRFNGDSISYLMTADRDGFGLLDTDFNEIIPCRYSQILPDADQQSVVVKTRDEKFGAYSRNGAMIVPAIYDELTTLSDKKLGHYAVRQDTLYGTYDRNGKVKLPVVFRQYLPGYSFQAPYIALPAIDGWHVFDSTGKLLVQVPFKADNVWNLKKTTCDTCFDLFVTKDGHRFPIDQNGKPLLPYTDYEFAFREENLIIASRNGRHGVLTYPDLRQIVPFEFEYVQEENGRFLVKKREWPYAQRWDVQTQTAKPLPVPFSAVGSFGIAGGLAPIHRDCKWYGFADSNFQVVIPMIYRATHGFAEGLAAVQDSNGQWGYIDRQGSWVILPKFSNAYSFQKGVAFVQLPGPVSGEVRQAIIDRRENVLFEWAYGPEVRVRRDSFYLNFENYPERGKNMLVDARTGKILLENCDCIQTKGDRKVWIKDGQLHVSGGALSEEEFQTTPYPDAGIKFVSFCGLTAMQDSKGKILIPFGNWSNYSVFPESRAVVIHINTENNHYLHKVYDLSGKPLQEIADAEVQPLNEYLLLVNRGEQVGLRNLKTGRELVTPGNFDFFPVKDQPLIWITSWEGRLLGYCDYEGNAYFRD